MATSRLSIIRYAFIFALCLCQFPLVAGGEIPELAFNGEGPTALVWHGKNFLGKKGFAVKRIVFEERGAPEGSLRGHQFADADVSSPRVEVDTAGKRIIHHYSWGRAALQHKVSDDRLDLTLTLQNTSDKIIADFEIHMLEFALRKRHGKLKDGLVYLTLDRPVEFEMTVGDAKCLVTCETFDPPVQFGLASERQFEERHDTYYGHSLVAQGGAPDFKKDTALLPLLGVPNLAPGETLRLHFVVRFAPANQPSANVLRPYYEAYRKAHQSQKIWADRRPVGKLIIPGSPMHVTRHNPRGWFDEPSLKISTAEGRATLREELMKLADQSIANLKDADAQGVIVWNIKGGHSFPDIPFGDPRRLADIAPEMDTMADAFFARFREAGLRVGVTVRPSMVYYSKDRQRWTHGDGYHDPEHESFEQPLKGVSPQDIAARRVYPLAERLSAKIAYAKKRWGCTIFYIHDNGFWWNARTDRPHEWLLVSADVLRRVRAEHPDVLLIPARSERHIRTARSDNFIRSQFGERATRGEQENNLATTLRGTAQDRVSGIKTPDWVVGNAHMYRFGFRNGINVDRTVPPPRHILHEAYWADAAPYVEIKLGREIKHYLMTLDQHTQYTEEKADQAVADVIPFETTPPHIREWMPGAFSVNDVDGANVQLRQPNLISAGAWGDLLMWDASKPAANLESIGEAVRAKQHRFQGLAQHLDLINPAPGAPVLPVALVWELGQSVDPGLVVDEDPVPQALRVRVAKGADGRRALLMFAWIGDAGRTIRLKPDLAGIGLPDGPKQLWQLPEGAALGGGGEILVTPDPVADVSAVLVHTGSSKSGGVPRGLLLGADFDAGIEPAAGSTPPLRRPEIEKAYKPGRVQNGALLLGDGSATAYNIVPNWFAGTVEFDIRPPASADKPVRVLTLKHHVELTLTFDRQQGKTGFTLKAEEKPIPIKLQEDPRKKRRRGRSRDKKRDKEEEDLPLSEPLEWHTFAPLPRGAEWRHVVLTWEIGQYVLYIDGQRTAALSAAAELRRRDKTVLEPGLILGGGDNAGGSRIGIDNLFVYDWWLPSDTASARSTRNSSRPVAKSDSSDAAVWLWGRFPNGAQVGMNFRDNPNWNQADKFRVTLYERLGGGRRQLGQIDLGAYGGVAVGDIPYRPSKEIVAGGGLSMDKAVDNMDTLTSTDDPFADEFMAEMTETLGKGTPYMIEIQPLPENDRLPAKTINFEARKTGVERHRQ